MRLLAGAGLVFFLAVLAYAHTVFGPVYPVAPGTPIRHDDFTFTVRSIRSEQQSKAECAYDVEVAIENQARAVNYTWNDRIAYVRDGRGPRFAAQSPRETTIAPGQTARVHLRFVVPSALRSPQLRFWDGVFMGDALDGVRYARAAVALKQPE